MALLSLPFSVSTSSPIRKTSSVSSPTSTTSSTWTTSLKTHVHLPPLRITRSLNLTRGRSRSLFVCMAPKEERMTRRSPLDFPIEWERPKPGRRPDIFPQFSPMKTPLPPPLPADPPEEDEEEEEEEKEEEEEENPETEEPEKPASQNLIACRVPVEQLLSSNQLAKLHKEASNFTRKRTSRIAIAIQQKASVFSEVMMQVFISLGFNELKKLPNGFRSGFAFELNDALETVVVTGDDSTSFLDLAA